jgi:hypothetical protein
MCCGVFGDVTIGKLCGACCELCLYFRFVGLGEVPIEDAEQGEEHLKQQLNALCSESPNHLSPAGQHSRATGRQQRYLLHAHDGASSNHSCRTDVVAATMAAAADVAVGSQRA